MNIINFVKSSFVIFILLTFNGQAQATTYSLPAQFGSGAFSGCTLSSGSTYLCSAVSLATGDVVNITSALTINVTGSMTVSDSVQINPLNSNTLSIVMQGAAPMMIGASDVIYSNITDGSTTTIGANTTINGNVSTSGYNITLGAGDVINGNLSSGPSTIPSTAHVWGLCTTSNAQCEGLVGGWRFDETSLTGAVGELADMSFNGFSGKTSGATADPSGEMCGALAFDGTSSYALIPASTALDTVYSSLASMTISVWVKVKAYPANGNATIIGRGAGGSPYHGNSIGITSSGYYYGNFVNASFSDKNALVNLPLPLNTWTHIVAVYANTSVKIYKNGTLLMSQATSNSALLSTIGNSIYFGATLGNMEFFNGSIDEPKIFYTALTALQVLSIYTNELGGKNWDGSSRTCATNSIPDHVELVHSGSSVSCIPEAVTILFCTTSASCNGVPSKQYTANKLNVKPFVQGATQETLPGVWCSDSLCKNIISYDSIPSFVNMNNNTTIYHFDQNVSSGGVYTTIAASSAGATSGYQCTNTQNSAFNSTSACQTNISSSGYLINIPNHSSCSSQTVSIQAVQSSNTSNACVPLFQNSRIAIFLSVGRVNPGTGLSNASASYTIDGAGTMSPSIVIPTGDSLSFPSYISPHVISPTSISPYFDSTGTAYLKGFSYPDVGKININVSTGSNVLNGINYSGTSNNYITGLPSDATGSSSVIVSPASLVVSPVDSTLKAGVPFNVTVSAYNGCPTPSLVQNFGKETIPSTVILTSSNPLPSAGNSTAINASISNFISGSGYTSVSWNEVGTFVLNASVNNYLGSGLNTASTLSSVGPFFPSYFNTVVSPSCNSFTYSGQPFATTVTAMATGGTVTANYAGLTWAKTVALSDVNGVAGTYLSNTIPATSFSNGVGVNSSGTFSFSNPLTVPSTITVQAVDSSGVSSATGIQGTNYLRSGRLRMLNSYGSEFLALPISMQAQYWVGSGYVLNTFDNCTTLAVPTSSSGLAVATLPTGKTTAKINGVSSGYGTLIGGDAGLVLSAPGYGNVGFLNATVTAPSWLQYNWNGAGNVSPSARATFGAYKSPYIYIRENY